MAVPNRIAALGGSGMVCGQSLCRQRLNRRHSALVRLSPANKPRDRAIVASARALAGALISTKSSSIVFRSRPGRVVVSMACLAGN